MFRSLLLLLLFLNSSVDKKTLIDTEKAQRILFVGNSLTYTNDLPALVQEIGKMDGKKITFNEFLLANYSLEDHWNEGKVKAEIEKGDYDFLVFQQGPSALPESQVLLLEYANRFAQVCRQHNSKMALYMVWPSKARLYDLDAVITSYTNAAEKTGSFLCPAGLAWKYAWEKDPSFPLYGSDGFHPGLDGSVLAALTVYGTLTEKTDFDFLLNRKSSWKNEIDEKKLVQLKAAALKAMGNKNIFLKRQ